MLLLDKIDVPFKWRSTLWILLAGGATLGISYWIWCFRQSSGDRKVLLLEESVPELTDTHSQGAPRAHRPSRTTSFSSRTSTTSGLRQVSVVLQPIQRVSIPLETEHTTTPLSDRDWGRLGLHTLADVVDRLEGLMTRIRNEGQTSGGEMPSDSQLLIGDLRGLLEQAYGLRELYKQKLIIQDPDFSLDSGEFDINSDDETGSYFSAVEEIDLTELELEITKNFHRPLYRNALKTLDRGEIPYRALRTQLVGCEKDLEYLAKLHCIRQAFDYIFSQVEPAKWLCLVGKLLYVRLLHCLNYPSSDFEEAYERLMSYVISQRSKPHISTMSEELLAKGVKVVNFYDVVIDLMLIEALELLSDPPNYILSVTRHRWLSDTFKRTTLDSTIWTILLAKRKLLKYPDGFYAHYYTLTGTVAPALAWGFLGADEGALRTCNRLRDLIIAFVKEAFIFYDQPKASVHTLENFSNSHGKLDRNSIDDYDAEASDLFRGDETFVPDRKDLEPGEEDDVSSDGDDDSTVVFQNTIHAESCNNAVSSSLPSTSSLRSRQTGLRYTTISDLSEDLYNLMIFNVQQLTRMLLDEARFANRPIPHELSHNPKPPILRLATMP